MKPEKEVRKDIFEWDVVNWSRALPFWKAYLETMEKDLLCLELGANRGGLSLWLAMQGHSVVCTDFHLPGSSAEGLHQNYQCNHRITYRSVDATRIPYRDHFDLVVFKSILGGISRDGQDQLKAGVLSEIHKALKPGGMLLFVENLSGSFMHRLMRKWFVPWGGQWNYLEYAEAGSLLAPFQRNKLKALGFFGAFGRSEPQRAFLGRLDQVLDGLIPTSQRYILIGMAQK